MRIVFVRLADGTDLDSEWVLAVSRADQDQRHRTLAAGVAVGVVDPRGDSWACLT